MTIGQIDRGVVLHNLDGFITRWRAKIDSWDLQERNQSERSHAQPFWIDFLRQFGIVEERVDLFQREADRDSRIRFERRADRATTGGHGYIDVFWSGMFIGEAKSIGKDLVIAERQALDYLAGGTISDHEFPKYVLSTDLQSFRLTRLGSERWTQTFDLEDLSDHVDDLMFLTGREEVSRQEQEDASVAASKVMARLYTAMVGDEDESVGDEAPQAPEDEDAQVQQASVFLTRLLFLLYGDDAGLWQADLFYSFVLNETTPSNLGAQLAALFDVLNTPQERRRNVPAAMDAFPYVNGALYADPMPTTFFTPDMRDALIEACRFRWTRISPAVFGSMFQMVKSREARRTAGEHYTSEENILKTLGPLFLDELQAEADRLCRNSSTTQVALEEFQRHIASMTFLDPACGSGNFLTVAYGRLRDIETQVIVELRRRQGRHAQMVLDATLETKVTIDQFYGFEVSWWPAKIAETAMFLIDHHANRKLALAVGEAPDRLPITITAHIHHVNALQTDWSAMVPPSTGPTYVFGNPPFLGHDTRSPEQAAELRAAWRRKDIGRLDYVTGWHAKTLDFLRDRMGDFAYVTTNSISQGDQVPRLFRTLLSEGWRIKFAHRTFAWTSEAPGKAAVHCVIVGFTRDTLRGPQLWDYPTPTSNPIPLTVNTGINPYLVDGPNVLVSAHHGTMNLLIPEVTFGSTPRDGGNLIIKRTEYGAFTDDPVAMHYVRPFKGARELLHGEERWCLWLVDLDPADLNRSELLRSRVEACRTWREASSSKDAREAAATPHLFWWRSQPDVPYLCIPSVVSETRRYFTAARLSAEVIASNAVFTAPDADGFAFGLVSSSMFMAWQRTTGGRLESRLRFSSTLTWNNFPLPPISTETHHAIISAGEGILAARRQRSERTLAELYNPLAMDPKLVKAHDALDREVDRAFGATKRLSTEHERLELLFQWYSALTE